MEIRRLPTNTWVENLGWGQKEGERITKTAGWLSCSNLASDGLRVHPALRAGRDCLIPHLGGETKKFLSERLRAPDRMDSKAWLLCAAASARGGQRACL